MLVKIIPFFLAFLYASEAPKVTLETAFIGLHTTARKLTPLNTCIANDGVIDWEKVESLLNNEETRERTEKVLDEKIIPCINSIEKIRANPNLILKLKESCDKYPDVTFSKKSEVCSQAALSGIGDVFGSANFFASKLDKCSAGFADIKFDKLQTIVQNPDVKAFIQNYNTDIVTPCIGKVRTIKTNPNFTQKLLEACGRGGDFEEKEFFCQKAKLASLAQEAFGSPFIKTGTGLCGKEWGKINWGKVQEIIDLGGEEGRRLVSEHLDSIKTCIASVSDMLGNQNLTTEILKSCSLPNQESEVKEAFCKKAKSSQLAASAFSYSVSECGKEWGKINWPSVDGIIALGSEEKLQVESHLNSKIKTCASTVLLAKKNPNFLKAFEDSCRKTSTSEIKQQICEDVAVALKVEKAFGTPKMLSKGNTFCDKELGQINWQAISQFSPGKEMDFANAHMQDILAPCVSDIVSAKRNPNFLQTLSDSCIAFKGELPQKDEFCARTALGVVADAFDVGKISSYKPACSRDWAKINWGKIGRYIDNGFGDLIREHVGVRVVPCIKTSTEASRNPNFVSKLLETCNTPLANNSLQSYVCELNKKGNAVIQSGTPDALTKYRFDSYYSRYFRRTVLTEEESSWILSEAYKMFDWDVASQRLVAEIPELRGSPFRLIARTYDVIEFMSKKSSLDPEVVSFITECNEKPSDILGYLFLSNSCSLRAQKIILNKFPRPAEVLEFSGTQVSYIETLKLRCTKNPGFASCSEIPDTLLKSLEASIVPQLLYGDAKFKIAPVQVDTNLLMSLKRCRNAATYNGDICEPLVAEILKNWPAQKEIDTDPSSYLLKNEMLARMLQTPHQIAQNVYYTSYDKYKSANDIFEQVYAMACILDTSFRIKSQKKGNEGFLSDQVSVLGDETKAKLQDVFSSLKEKLKEFSQKDIAALSKLSGVVSNNLSSLPKGSEYLKPTKIPTYTTIINPGILNTLKGEQPLDKKLLPEDGIVNFDAIYGVLSKICISILGSGYLEAEEKIISAFNQGGWEMAMEALKIIKARKGIPEEENAFSSLPTSSYNKLKQLSLILLSNLQILLLAEYEPGVQFISQNIKEHLPRQIAFFSRFLLSLVDENYEASDISKSAFADEFCDIFLMSSSLSRPVVSLVEEQGSNLYSLYVSFLKSALYNTESTEHIEALSLDTRSKSNQLVHNFTQQYGKDTLKSIQVSVSQHINLAVTSLIPIPVVNSIAAGVINFAVTTAAEKTVEAISQSCRFNRKACVSTDVSYVNLSKPLIVRVTEFLSALEKGLSSNESMMPILSWLKGRNDAQSIPGKDVKTIQELMDALIERSTAYFGALFAYSGEERIDPKDI